jgi:Ca-activated chloride channel homolog
VTRRAAACTMAMAASVTLAAHGQNPVFSAKVEAVRVDVLVSEGGRPVRGLRAGDFEVLDNGVPQHVDLVSFEQLPLNVVLTFDMSGSVVGERLANLREAGRAVLDGLRPADQAALVSFNHVVAMGGGLTGVTSRVRQTIEWADPAGSTSLIDASFAGMLLGESDVGRALVIVFSDGIDTSSWLEAKAVLEVAKRFDAVVYAATAALGANADFLRDLTEQTGGRLIRIESTKNLSGVFLQVLEEFRQRYVVSYSPAGVSREGWHQLAVRVKGRNATIRARPGYLAGQ